MKPSVVVVAQPKQEARTTRILLVTPVHGRFPLTEAALQYRRQIADWLGDVGVELGCAVIGDDANLEVAERLGFTPIEAPNLLGRKFNDGHEHAVANGYDWSIPLGSDQFIDPRLLTALCNAPSHRFVASRHLSVVTADRKKILDYVMPKRGWALKMYSRSLLESDPRPCIEGVMRRCDTLTHKGVSRANRRVPQSHHWIGVGRLENVQFQTKGEQVTDWETLLARLTDARAVPWRALEAIYGTKTIRALRSSKKKEPSAEAE